MPDFRPIPSKIAVHVHLDISRCTLQVEGHLDAYTVPVLEDRYIQARTALMDYPVSPILIVDLRNLSFIDSAGLALLVSISRYQRATQRKWYTVVTEHSQPDKVLKLGRFNTLFDIMYDVLNDD